MLADYVGILVICVAGALLIGAMLGAHRVLGPKRDAREDSDALASDAVARSAEDQSMAAKFYLAATLCVVLAVATSLLYPWAAVLSELSWFGYGAVLVFLLPLGVGLIYAWLKGGLEW